MGVEITSRGRLKRNRSGYFTSKVPIKAQGGYSGTKRLSADGANSTGGDQQITLTGAVVGDHVVDIWGQVKAESGVNTVLNPAIGTDFEATISVADKIIQKQDAGDLSANTYRFILEPAS